MINNLEIINHYSSINSQFSTFLEDRLLLTYALSPSDPNCRPR
jgi:hypothetical protein